MRTPTCLTLSTPIVVIATNPHVAGAAAIVDIAAKFEVAGPCIPLVTIGLILVLIWIVVTIRAGVDQAPNSQTVGAPATIAGAAEIDAYEMDLVREGKATCRLILSAHKLDYFDTDKVRIVLAATDVTPTRLAEKQKDDLVREKQILLQELQHRVANSLQIIASVLMQSAKRVQSDETRLYLQDAHSRVMSIAMLQKQLAVTQLKSVELRTYFADLCRSISASMIEDPKRLTLEAIVDDTTTNSDVSVSMGLIVTELVINAIKHAFPDQSAGGKITVSFTTDKGAWLLSVSDNGAGMPVGKNGGKPGLGTGIVEALSKQLDATVTVIDANPGTRVEIRHDQS